MEKSRYGSLVYAQKVLKRSLFLFLLINLLSISPTVSASTSLLEQEYTLNLSFKNARLEQVLDAIMKQSGVKIAYSSDELQKDRVISVDIRTTDILTALRTVLGDGYSFKQIEDYIAIARVNRTESTVETQVDDDRQWTIQGQVMENVEPPMSLPGVNVVIKGTTLGTGGMITKIHAAEIAMDAGIDMIIANGTRPELLYKILDGDKVGTKFIGRKKG